MNKTLSFPHLGSYYIALKYFFSKVTDYKILVPPPITKKTLELGSKYSPDFVCLPFKYNLGNYIEALENKANILLQFGGGCRYGYYAELQEKILRDLGYEFEFVNFIKNNHVSIFNIYKFCKKQKKCNIFKFIYYLINVFSMIISMDKLDRNLRENAPFEIEKNSFKKVHNCYLTKLENAKGLISIIKIHFKYKKKYKKIPIDKPKDHLKIGLLGELYSLMEQESSYNIESILTNYKIEVKRYTTITYLLLQKKFKLKHLLKKGRKYLKYHLGADATESVVKMLELAEKNFDGIVHIKCFGCTPELNAVSIMDKISNDYNIPVLHFSFDTQEAEAGIHTRLEAFYDMLVQRKNKL